jgi:Ser/Thr protein kinase RdoA (MazF antagonist)
MRYAFRVPPAHAAVLGVCASYFSTDDATVARVPTGLIQETFVVTRRDGTRVIAQRMHPMYTPEVLIDTEAVTAHLARAGLATPQILRTRGGELSVTGDEGRRWRLLTFLDGHTVERVDHPSRAETAASLVARFHRAVATLDHTFLFVRANVHNTALHLGRLEQALSSQSTAETSQARPLAEEILRCARLLPPLPADLPHRISHGDLKISNVLFTRSHEALALIDLDTLGRLPLAHELGDAWRSWCNPGGEDTPDTSFSLDIFAAAVKGYAAHSRDFVSKEEAALLVVGVETIAVELAARFCLDVFEDRYFGWDPSRFPSRKEHNRVRAAGQLHLASEIARARGDAERIVRRNFSDDR